MSVAQVATKASHCFLYKEDELSDAAFKRIETRRPAIARWLITALAPIMISCSAVVGPHKLTVENHGALTAIHIKGYGCNAVQSGDISALHLGWYCRTLVFEDNASLYLETMSDRFSFFRRLPSALPLHHSSLDAGMALAWEPTFRGLSFGYQSRSVSRLPLDRDLIFESSRTPRQTFSLRPLP